MVYTGKRSAVCVYSALGTAIFPNLAQHTLNENEKTEEGPPKTEDLFSPDCGDGDFTKVSPKGEPSGYYSRY
jgi:hypothetical protein